MSLTPVFDATLADAPVNIWEASNVFPRPTKVTIQAGEFVFPAVSYFTPILADPANLAFLRSIA